MKDDKLSQTTLNQTVTESSPSSNNEDAQRHWHSVVKRRSFSEEHRYRWCVCRNISEWPMLNCASPDLF